MIKWVGSLTGKTTVSKTVASRSSRARSAILLALVSPLAAANPAIDGGAWLVTVKEPVVNSTRVTVWEMNSAWHTFIRQGWPPGYIDTRIQFEGQRIRPSVIGIESDNVLILDQPVSIEGGRGGAFPYCGNAPDIGGVESDCSCGEAPVWEEVCTYTRPVPPEVY